MRVLSPREASIFACVTDTVVAPGPRLPAVRDTGAVDFLDRWLAAAPALNRVALRTLLLAAEWSPLLAGERARLRALPEARRAAVLERLGGSPLGRLVKSLAFLAYYGDDGVMRQLGYDADAVIERARALRAAEGRP